jgi:tRNA-modifying protein YgfZ
MTVGDSTIADDQSRAFRDYQNLRGGRGFVELVGWSSVTVTGADRQTFLHNFCTNDVRRLLPGQNCEAFITSVKGKILGHGLVSCRENELVFITVPGQAPLLLAHFDRYVIREDVTLRDTTSERIYLLLSDGGLVNDALPFARWIQWDLIRRPGSGLIEVSPTDLFRARDALEARAAAPCGLGAFETLRIEAGTPLYGIDFNDENLPQEVGRDDRAISFTKGCYLGQETVARIDALGHVNQQIAGVQFAETEIPTLGSELKSAGKVVGHVTSATFSPRLVAPLALAMVRRDALAPGSELETAVGRARVVSPPVGDANN